MALTLAAAVKELEKFKHARSIWMETVEHLSRFVGSELKNADSAIVAEGCVVSTVPEPVIREFIQYINVNEIDPLNKQIEALEGLTVEETNESKTKDAGNDRDPPQAQKKQGTATIGIGKKLRAIPGTTGPKVQGAS